MKRRLFTIAAGLVLSTLAHAQVDCLSWKKVEGAVSGPAPRIRFCMEYDSIRDRVVLFGGIPYGDIVHPDEITTWEWDGEKWETKEIPGPPKHAGGSMAFDSSRGVMVLWCWPGETWEYDGQTWTLRSTLGPAPSDLDPMCFDSDRNVCVLLTDNKATWEWDGVTWTPRGGLGPNVERWAAMDYDPIRKVCVLNGGSDGTVLNATWEWNGNSWALKNTGVSIQEHEMVFSSTHSKVLRYGSVGTSGNAKVEFSTWDGAVWTPVASGGAIPRRSHRMVATPKGLVVFSGEHAINHGATATSVLRRPDLSLFSNGVWEVLSAGNPGPRASSSLAYHPDEERVYMTSGGTEGVWGFQEGKWSLLTEGPDVGASYAGLAFDTGRQRMVLVMKAPESTTLQQHHTFEWNGTDWVLTHTGNNADYPRVLNDAIGYDPVLQTIVAVDDQNVFRYDGAAWTRPGFFFSACGGAFDEPSFAHDPLSSTNLILNCSTMYGWNGTTTYTIATGLPITACRRPMFRAFPPTGGGILFGGEALASTGYPVSLNQLWHWKMGSAGSLSWQQLNIATPESREGMSSTYDSVRGVIVAFGGAREVDGAPTRKYFNDTWELSTDTGITSHPASLSVQAGHGAEFKVSAFGAQLQYQWRRDGQPIIDGPRISGANTDTLTIDPVVTGDDGEYDVIITSPCGNLTSQSASLDVTCYADCIPDGSLDIFDFFCFGNAFATSQPYADCDGDGQHDIFDFLCFQTSFALGCP